MKKTIGLAVLMLTAVAAFAQPAAANENVSMAAMTDEGKWWWFATTIAYATVARFAPSNTTAAAGTRGLRYSRP